MTAGRDGLHPTTCPLCEATCGILVEVRDGRVAAVRGDADDPFSRGHICPKAPALKDLHEDPDRLRRPHVRDGDRWREVDWDEAIATAAAGLHRVQQDHGPDAVGVYLGNPTVHNLGAMLTAPNFVRTLRTKNRFSATSVDQLPHMVVAYHMWGHQLLLPIPDIDRTDVLLIVGGNPLASNGSLMTAPDVKGRLKEIRRRGGRVVVLDPRRTETAKLADEHHFVRPGSDALLLLALIHVILDEDRVRPSPAFALGDGLSEVRSIAAQFAPERVAAATGVAATTIRALAATLADAERAVVYGRVGVSTQAFGTLCHWAIAVLNLITGNFDRPGGAMFTRPAVDGVAAPGPFALGRGSHGRWRSRVRGLEEFGGELPVAVLGEEMLTPGAGQIRGMVTFAGNPVLSTPNGGQLERGFAGLDYYVAIDPYLNETTRHADVILPPVGALERDHVDVAFGLLTVRNTFKYAPAVLPAPTGSRQDWQIVLDLQEALGAARHGGRAPLGERLQLAAIRRLGPRGLIDLGLRLGPYGMRAWPPRRGLTLKRVLRRPHGLDLGPLEPCLPDRLPGRRRIDLAPARIVADVPRLAAAWLDDADDGVGPRGAAAPLRLIGRRHLRDNNSWLHNAPSLMTGRPRCTLLIHPDDAAARDIADGAAVCVRSRVGEVVVPAQHSDDVMPGVVCLPHGYGHGRPGTRMQVANAHAGASVNDLNDDQRVDQVCGTAAFSGQPVTVHPEPPGA